MCPANVEDSQLCERWHPITTSHCGPSHCGPSHYLCYDSEAGIDCGRFVNVKYEVGIFYQIDPESQWKTV